MLNFDCQNRLNFVQVLIIEDFLEEDEEVFQIVLVLSEGFPENVNIAVPAVKNITIRSSKYIEYHYVYVGYLCHKIFIHLIKLTLEIFASRPPATTMTFVVRI